MTRSCVGPATMLGAVLMFVLAGCGSMVPRTSSVVEDVRHLTIHETLAPDSLRRFTLDQPLPALVEGGERSHAILLALPPLASAHEVVIRSYLEWDSASFHPARVWNVAYPRVRLLGPDFTMLREIAPGRFAIRNQQLAYHRHAAIVASIYVAGDGRERFLLVTAASGTDADSRLIPGRLPDGTIRFMPTGTVDVLLRSLAGDVVTTY